MTRDFPTPIPSLGSSLTPKRSLPKAPTSFRTARVGSLAPGQFYYQLAIAHFGLKQYSLAEEEYLKVQSLNPNAPADLHVKLADVYLKENAYDKAYAQMQAYLQAEPQGRFVAKIKAIMRQMESSEALRVPPTQAAQPPPG